MMFAPLGDSAVVVTLGDAIDESMLVRVRSLTAELERAALPGLIDVVPAYSTVTIFYDAASPAYGDEPPYEHLCRVIAEHVAKVEHAWPDLVERKLTGGGPTELEIPVCYGGEFGPDLDDVGRHCGLTTTEVVARHSEPTYLVCAVGFTPGFPYLSGLPKILATPRRATPRTTVAAGSVGIGGMQTGIYPRSTPGGWQLIGRTPVSLFDVAAKLPARLRVGDHVRFRSITPEDFATWK